MGASHAAVHTRSSTIDAPTACARVGHRRLDHPVGPAPQERAQGRVRPDRPHQEHPGRRQQRVRMPARNGRQRGHPRWQRQGDRRLHAVDNRLGARRLRMRPPPPLAALTRPVSRPPVQGATVDVETTTTTTLEGSASASGRFPWSKSYSLLRLFSILALFCLGAAFAHSSYSATAALLSSQRYDWPWPRAAAAPPPPTPLLHLAASANELPKEQPEGEPTLADGCRYVFLDVGSNIGNHVRFLYEAEKFPGSSYAKIFNETFPVNRGRPDVCAFGWEANSAHVPWLNRLQQAYKQQGWLAHWFAPVAVADKDGTIEFWHVNDTSHNEWGYSMRHLGAGFKEVVRAMDLARWINAHVHRRRVPDAIREDDPPPAVVMKMDIEGSEFSVLPSLMATGAMCSISYLTVEYHCAGSPKKKDKCHIKKKHLKDALDSVHKECPGNVKKLKASQLDDEAYALRSCIDTTHSAIFLSCIVLVAPESRDDIACSHPDVCRSCGRHTR